MNLLIFKYIHTVTYTNIQIVLFGITCWSEIVTCWSEIVGLGISYDKSLE